MLGALYDEGMSNALERCGARFAIEQRPPSRWPLLVALVVTVLALFVFLKSLWILPVVAWVAIIVRLASAPSLPAAVTITPRALQVGSVEIAFGDVNAVQVVEGGVVLETADTSSRIELAWLSNEELNALAKHLEARVLLAHGPPRGRDEVVALEAFHALDAHAVRVRDHAA